jgi:putative oxidoreductase
MKSGGILALRLVIAFIFVYSGYGKLFPMHDMAVQGFGAMGFPAPAFWVWFVGIVEVVGGLMVLFGIFTRVAASWLAIVMVVAMATAHRGGPFTGYFLPLVILGSCLALVGVGAGKLRLVRPECPCSTCRKGCSEDMKEGGCTCGKGGMCSCGKNEQTESCCGNNGVCCKDKSMNSK